MYQEGSLNYSVLANTDDGSCIEIVAGCTQPSAYNYDSNANQNDGSCIAVVFGCTDSTSQTIIILLTQIMDLALKLFMDVLVRLQLITTL